MLLICLLPMTGITAVGFLGYENGMGKDYWEVGIPGIEKVLKYFFAGQPLYLAVVFGTKISLVLLYLRIFLTDARALRAACWIVVSALAMSLVAFEFATIFQCIPISYNWTRFNGATGHCTDQQAQVYAAAGINIFFNVLVIVMPLGQILRLGISPMKKIGICSVFLVGVVVIACSCVRLQYLIRYGTDENVTYNYTYIGIWTLIEVHLSIVCVCMPATAGLAYRTWKFAQGDEVATMTRPGTAADGDEKKLMRVGGVPAAEEGRVLATEGQVRGLGLQGVEVESTESSEDDQRGFYFDGKFFTEGQARGGASDAVQMMTLDRNSVQKPEAAHLKALRAEAAAELRSMSPDHPHLARGRSVPGKDDDRTATAALEDTASGAGSGNSDESGSKACADANEELAAIRADMSLNPTRNPTENTTRNPTETTTEHNSKITSMNSPQHDSNITSQTLSRQSSDNGVRLPTSNESLNHSFDAKSGDTSNVTSGSPSTANINENHPLRSQGVSMPNSRPTTPSGDHRRAEMTRSASSSLFNSRRASGEHAEQILKNAHQREEQKQNGRPREVTRSASSSLFNSMVPTRRPSTADGARSSGGMISTPDNRGQSGDLRAARYARSYVAYYERPSPVPIQPSSGRNESEESLNTKRNNNFQAILEAKRQSLRSRSNDSSLFKNPSNRSFKSDRSRSIDSTLKNHSDRSIQSINLDNFESIGNQLRTESEQRLAVEAAYATLGVELDMPLGQDDGVPVGEDQTGPWPNVAMGDTEPDTEESSRVVSPLIDDYSNKHSHIVSPMSPDYRPADPQADVPQRQYSQPPSPGRPGFSHHPLENMRTQPLFSRTSTGNSSHALRSQSRPVSSAEAKRNSDSERAAAILCEMQGNRDYDGHRHQSTDEGEKSEEHHTQRPAELSRAPSLRTQMRAIQQPTFDQQVRESHANIDEPPSMRGHMFPGTSEEQPPSIVQQHLEQLSAITSASNASGERRSGDSGQSDETHDSTYSSAESGELDRKQQERLDAQYSPSSPTDGTYTTADEDQSVSDVHPLQNYTSEGNPYEASNLKDDLMDIPSRVTAVVVDGPSGRYELRRTLTDVSFDKPSAEEILAVTPQEGWRHQITGQSYFPDPQNMADSTAAMLHKIPTEKLVEAGAWNNDAVPTEHVTNQAATAGSWHNTGGLPRSSSNSRPRFVEEYNTNRWRSFTPKPPPESRGSSVNSFFRRQEDNSYSGIYSDRNNNVSQGSGFRQYPEDRISPRRPSSFDGSFYNGSDNGSRQNFRPQYEQQFPMERPQYSRYNSGRSFRPQYDDRQYSNYGSEQNYRPRYDDQISRYDDRQFSPERRWHPRYDSYRSFRPRNEEQFSEQFSPPREYQSRPQSYHSFRPQNEEHFSPPHSLQSRRTSNYSFHPQAEGQFSPQRPQPSRYSSNLSDASFRQWKSNHQYQPTGPHPTEEIMSLIAQHEMWNERNPTEFSRDGTEPSQAVNLERKSNERLAFMENELPDLEAVDYSRSSSYQNSRSTSQQEDPGSPGISVPQLESDVKAEHRDLSDDWNRIQKQQEQERRDRRTSGYQSSEGQRSRTDNDAASEASTQKWNPIRPASQQTSNSTLRPTSTSSNKSQRDSRDSWLEDQEARRQIAATDQKDEKDRKASRYSGIYAYDPPTAEMVSAIAGPTNEWGIDHEKPVGIVAPIKPPSPVNTAAKWAPVASPEASRSKVPQVKDTKEDLPLRANPEQPKISSFQEHRSSQTALYKPQHSRQSSSLSNSTIGKSPQSDEYRHDADDGSQQAKDVEQFLKSGTGYATGDATSGAQRHLMAYQDHMEGSPASRLAQKSAESRPTTALENYRVGSPDLKKPHRDPHEATKMHEQLSNAARSAQQTKIVSDYESPTDTGFPPSLTTEESSEDSTYSSTDMSDSEVSSPSPHNSMDATSTIPRFRPAEAPKYRFNAGTAKKGEDVPRYIPTEEDTRRRAKAYALARQIIQKSRGSSSSNVHQETHRRPSTADGDFSARPSPPKQFEAFRSDDKNRRQKATDHVEAVSKKVSERASTTSTNSSGSSGSAPLSEQSLKGIGSKHGPGQRASDVDVKTRPGQKGRELRMSWQG